MKKVFTFLLLAFLTQCYLNAQTKTIHVETAGTLPDLISTNDKYKITDLTVTGYLNGTDMRFIREMAGKEGTERDGVEKDTKGILCRLNLTNSKIVSGAGWYYAKLIHQVSPVEKDYWEYYYTSDDEISYRMFYRITNLEHIDLPKDITEIGKEAFAGCSNIKAINIPNQVNVIDYDAFNGCSSTTSITLHDNLTKIYSRAFSGCSRVNSIELPNSLTFLGESAFSNCTNLSSVYIPNSLIFEYYIGVNKYTNDIGSAFASCTGINEYIISETNPYYSTIDGILFSKNKSTIIAYPLNKKNTSYTIPENVMRINKNCFYGSVNLSTIILPYTLTEVGESSMHCSNLKTIYIKSQEPPKIKSSYKPASIFSGNAYTESVLFVPSGTISKYKNSEVWKEFNNIREGIPSSINTDKTSLIKIYAESNSIIVQDAEIGETISVYSESGILIKNIKATDNINRIELSDKGIYIVRIGNQSFKVIL